MPDNAAKSAGTVANRVFRGPVPTPANTAAAVNVPSEPANLQNRPQHGLSGAVRKVLRMQPMESQRRVNRGESTVMEFPSRQAVEAALLSSESGSHLGVFCVRRGRNGGKVLSVVLQPQRVTHFSLSWVSV